MAQSEIEVLLDSISSTLGSIIVRTGDGWVALTPGTAGEVLTIDGVSGLPDWAPASGGGGGGVRILALDPFDMHYSRNRAVDYFHGKQTILPRSTSITKVCFFCTAANTTTEFYPAIYDMSTGVMTSLLATGPKVTGCSFGINELPLTTPYSVSSDQPIAFGFVNHINSIDLAHTVDVGACYFPVSTTPPDPAPSATYTSNTSMPFWLSTET